MDATLKQVGELLLGAIPTVIFVTLLYFFYRVLVHQPLAKVLDERRSRTTGAVERAKTDIASAEARTADYERKLREARLAVFKAQEERRQAIVKARDEAVAEARSKAHAQVAAAKAAIEQEKAAAQAVLQGESERLAAAIVRTVLAPANLSPSASGGRG